MKDLELAYAISIGILSARETGVGRNLDVSLFDMALFNLCYPGTWYLNTGVVQQREPRSGHPSLVPCALYTTKDGWIFLMCNKEKFWPVLCGAIGRPEWGDAPRFITFEERLKNRHLIQKLLDGELQRKTTSDWLDIFAGSVPAAPLHDIKGALENPFVSERGRVQTLEIEGYGEAKFLDTPIKSGDPTPTNPAPTLGQHTEDLLFDIGYDAGRMAKLRSLKII